MKALTYGGPGVRAWETVPDPSVREPTDVVVEIGSSTICGTDLHILEGDVPTVEPGRILGHEAMGTVVDAGLHGDDGRRGRPRPRLLHHCLRPLPLLQGGPVRHVHRRRRLDPRAPDRRAPGGVRSRAVRRHVRVPGSRAAHRRAGAVPRRHPPHLVRGRPGAARRHDRRRRGRPDRARGDHDRRLFTPGRIIAIDLGEARLAQAAEFGADVTIQNSVEDPVAAVMELTGGLGADVAIEAVGVPETFELCTELIRTGGHVANVGVHGRAASLHLETLWIRGVTITTGLVDTYTTPQLLRLIEGGRLDPTVFATHRFALEETMEAYDVFANAAETHALKVVLEGERAVREAPAALAVSTA